MLGDCHSLGNELLEVLEGSHVAMADLFKDVAQLEDCTCRASCPKSHREGGLCGRKCYVPERYLSAINFFNIHLYRWINLL